jgi:hypothetical protein
MFLIIESIWLCSEILRGKALFREDQTFVANHINYCLPFFSGKSDSANLSALKAVSFLDFFLYWRIKFCKSWCKRIDRIRRRAAGLN